MLFLTETGFRVPSPKRISHKMPKIYLHSVLLDDSLKQHSDGSTILESPGINGHVSDISIEHTGGSIIPRLEFPKSFYYNSSPKRNLVQFINLYLTRKCFANKVDTTLKFLFLHMYVIDQFLMAYYCSSSTKIWLE